MYFSHSVYVGCCRFRFEGQGSGEVLWLMDGMATRRRKRSRMPKQNRAAAYSPAIMGLMYTAPKMHVTVVYPSLPSCVLASVFFVAHDSCLRMTFHGPCLQMVSNRPGGAATCGDDCFEYMLHRRLSRDDGRGSRIPVSLHRGGGSLVFHPYFTDLLFPFWR